MFAIWLKKSRRALGLTQQELGRLAGVGESAISMWERGRRVPGPRATARLRAFFADRGVAMPAPSRGPGLSEEERFRREVQQVLLAGGSSFKKRPPG